jgi:agmatinase
VTDFDPDAAADPDSGLFGLDTPLDQAAAAVIPIGFDATTSYRTGTAAGPEWVRRASHQVDLHDRLFGDFWERGIASLPRDPRVDALQSSAFPRARRVVEAGGRVNGCGELEADQTAVNLAGEELNRLVAEHTSAVLARDALPVVLGGDHAVPFGAIAAAADLRPGLGLLHFDAHADLRQAYEGFTWSHASILFNLVERCAGVDRVLQVGIRDLCGEEQRRIDQNPDRIRTIFDDAWARCTERRELIEASLDFLPEEVWITFDVDGLDPSLCPSTGTPVPGGLGWHDAMAWLEALSRSGRRVVGLDLVEVSGGPLGGASTPPVDAPDPWDAIVGARLLYRLIGCALSTRG